MLGAIWKVEGKKLYRWYRVLSRFSEKVEELTRYDIKDKQGQTKSVPILKPENLGPDMAIDDKNIDGEMWTVLSNRQSGKIALMAETIKTEELLKLSKQFGEKCFEVKTITADMSLGYEWFNRQAFMNATRVTDKFHVVKEALDNLQAIRIRHRQQHLQDIGLQREAAKKEKKKVTEPRLSHGETKAELLARSRYLPYTYRESWKPSQAERAKVLFAMYPEINTAYDLLGQFRKWYDKGNLSKAKETIKQELVKWYEAVKQSNIDEMLSLKSMIERHEVSILNYFHEGKTNAKAEALNGKIQAFIRTNYGIRDKLFFLYRLKNYYS